MFGPCHLQWSKIIGLIGLTPIPQLPKFQEEILEEPPDLSQYPLMVDLVKHAGPNWSDLYCWGVSCEIWEMQIDVLGGSQRCNQKECVGNESLVHSI